MNNVAKCGSGTILTPAYLGKSFGSPAGSLKTTTGDSCLWTILGNQSDFTTALSLYVNALVGLCVSIFNGQTFSQSLLISENLTTSFRLYLPLLNNTYILASPLPSNLKTATLNLSFSLLSNVYRLPPPETIKSMT